LCREVTVNIAEYFHPTYLQLKYDELETLQRQNFRLDVLYAGV